MYEVLCQTAKIAPKLPYRLRVILAAVAGRAAWAFAIHTRRNVTGNVIRVLNRPKRQSLAGRIETQRIVRRIFCSCTHNYLELLASPRPADIIDRFDVSNAEFVDEALSLGRGVVLFSAHLGPFEYLSSWFSARGYRMVIPVENVEDKRMLRLMLELRRRNGVEFVPAGNLKSMRRIFAALRDNQIVLITADRAIVGDSVVTNFFGAPARLPTGPVDLSVRTGAPLVGAFGWRAGGRIRAEFTRLSQALPEDRRSDRAALQDALTRHLERMIRDHIDQWAVFDPIWDAAIPLRDSPSHGQPASNPAEVRAEQTVL
jgi:lauroyl/myristoyl acyltransferase